MLSSGLQSGLKVNHFSCECGCGESEVEQELIDKVQKLRELTKSKFVITSAVRCEKFNAQGPIVGSKNSPHLVTKSQICMAADIQDIEYDTGKLFLAAVGLEFNGVGLYMGKVGPYLHVDVKKDRRNLFTYWYHKDGYHYFTNAGECLQAYKTAYSLA